MQERRKICELEDGSIQSEDLFIKSNKQKTTKVTAQQIAEYVSNSNELHDEYVEKNMIGSELGVAPLDETGKIPGQYINYGKQDNTAFEGSEGESLRQEFNSHTIDYTLHFSEAEKEKLKNLPDESYSKNEVDNKFSAFENDIDWKESVETYNDILITYPEPEDGWTVNTKDTNYTYRFNGEEWIVISVNAIPLVTKDVDGILSHDDYNEFSDANSKKHTHENESILNSITQDMINHWNEGNNLGVKNKYVCASKYGIYYSDDNLTTFSKIKEFDNTYFNSIIYVEEKGIFIATKNSGGITYSYDGINWTFVDLSNYTNDVYAKPTKITYGNGHFVCSCSRGFVLYSTDCNIWYSGINVKSEITFKSVAYGNGNFIVVGDNGSSYYSNDGETWNEMSGLDTDKSYCDVVYGNNRFVCVSNYSGINNCAYSIDAVTWVTLSTEYTAFSKISYGNDKFIASNTDNKILSSEDGITWNEIKNINININNVVFTNNQFWCFTTLNNTYNSVDGETWDYINIPVTSIMDMTYREGKSGDPDYVTRNELQEYAQPKIAGFNLNKITVQTTEPDIIEDGEIVFVYEE